ncbi:unnamed protein product [Candidula unifasciata]|uniref:Protein SHQ1 homolog n=1 Tax=Candidula unifasciata TaxID=100452 RepID=A0A8S4A3Q3_9EUPU|nr:unnamed protein product [Candidula unifasciata]
MLTPRFSLSQDADLVYIHITAPYIKVSESECYIQDDEFYFYSQPYYLRLHLPGQIVENELSTSKYDVDTGQLTVRVAKETKGETFEGLDMLTKLLTPKAHACRNREIEVLGNSDEQPCDSKSKIVEAHGEVKVSDDEAADDDEFDWFLEQKINESPCHVLTKGPSYGFAHRKSNVLQDLITGIPELLDLKDPDHVPSNERRALRELQENEQFNCEHYLADLFDDEVIRGLVLPDYPELTGTAGEETVFNEAEKEKLRQLPRREYIISDSELKTTYLGLVDLVFAYAYNFRFTQGEGNVESDWTICKLSSTLSWLDSFDNIHDVVLSCARRSLCFPLYRSWDLFTRVLNDVKTIFMMGRSQVLKCLLGIHTILKESETRYPLNDLYIIDYCVWLQSADSKRIASLGKALEEVKLSKADLGLRLEEMEADARKLTDECQVNTYCHSSEGKQGDIERLAEALSDIVNVKDSVVDSDDDECDSKDEDFESDEESTDNDETDDETGSDESDDSQCKDEEKIKQVSL